MLWMPARMASSSAEEEVGAGGMGGGGVEEEREGAVKEEEEDDPLCMAGSSRWLKRTQDNPVARRQSPRMVG